MRVAVALLKAGGASVFLDVNDLNYGDLWEEKLTTNITRCDRVLVFWSAAASKSTWVTREWRLAVEMGKCTVPVMLDETRLPDGLDRFHGMTELRTILDQQRQLAHRVEVDSFFGLSLPASIERFINWLFPSDLARDNMWKKFDNIGPWQKVDTPLEQRFVALLFEDSNTG